MFREVVCPRLKLAATDVASCCQVWLGSILIWIERNCLTMRCLWKKFDRGENLYPYFLSCFVTKLRSFPSITKPFARIFFRCSWDVRGEGQAGGMGISSISLGNSISLGLSSSLVCSSLAAFSLDLANISLRLYLCEAWHWYSLAFRFFLSSVADDLLP